MDGIEFMTIHKVTIESVKTLKKKLKKSTLCEHSRESSKKYRENLAFVAVVHFSFLEALGMKTVRLHSAQIHLNSINYTKFSPPDFLKCGVCLKTNEL